MEGIIEILNLVWHGHEVEGLVKGPVPVVTAAIIGGAANLFGSLLGAGSANSRAKRAAREKRRLEAELTELENSRQAIINPYAGVSDLSSIAEDLTSRMTNPFENLGVATQAAEIQIEQTDIALANTLDALAATGASAGGATALAQAALASKKGVAANIEQQEATNEKLRAQGEASLEANKISEAQRLQNIQLQQAGKVEQAQVQGEAFMFGEVERRETEQLNRKQAQITGQAQTAAQARADAANILGAGIGGVSDIASSYLQSTYKPQTPPPLNTSDIYAGKRYSTNYEAQTRAKAADVFGGGTVVPMSAGAQNLYGK